MTLIMFSILDSLKWISFFEKNFLLVNTSIKVILRILFLFFSNADVKFAKQLRKLT